MELGKRELVECLVRELGFEHRFRWMVNGEEVVDVFVRISGLLRMGRVWWRDSDGSVVRCARIGAWEGVRVDLADPESVAKIKLFFRSWRDGV